MSFSVAAQAAHFSNDGKLVAIISPDNVAIIHADTCQAVATIPEPNVISVAFSPQNVFLLMWKRWSKEQQATGVGNVSIWDIKNSERVHDFVQKKAQWYFSFFFPSPMVVTAFLFTKNIAQAGNSVDRRRAPFCQDGQFGGTVFCWPEMGTQFRAIECCGLR
jgi:uncharacterized protein with WD repeat